MRFPAFALYMLALGSVAAQAPPVLEVQPSPGVAVGEVAVALQEELLPEPSVAALRQLATGLGAESFEIRERSQSALAKYARQHPTVVRDGLAKDYVDTLDPEVRYRLAEVLYDAVVEEMEHSGFLGIIMLDSTSQMDGKPVASIQVNRVLGNSAAARAGLQVRDQIVQVDDMTFDPRPANRNAAVFRGVRGSTPNLEKFKTYISGKKKGALVKLKVQRVMDSQLKMLNVNVRLGRRTRELMELDEQLREDQFFDKWLKERAAETRPKP